jgi:hypothetical protein
MDRFRRGLQIAALAQHAAEQRERGLGFEDVASAPSTHLSVRDLARRLAAAIPEHGVIGTPYPHLETKRFAVQGAHDRSCRSPAQPPRDVASHPNRKCGQNQRPTTLFSRLQVMGLEAPGRRRSG